VSAELPLEVHLLRHGRTVWNLEGRAQGHTDVELDDVGHRQAKAAAAALAGLEPTRIVTSDLRRATQTAAYVEQETGLRAVLEPRLRETSWGVREGLTLAEFAARHPEEHAAWEESGRTLAIAGGEAEADVLVRVSAAMRDLVASVQPGERVVVISHGGALKSAVAALLDWPDADPSRLRGMANCAVTRVDVERGRGTLVAYNVPTSIP
jgi:broad specificity phosphatase PhoE